jgi:hypothetical protein
MLVLFSGQLIWEVNLSPTSGPSVALFPDIGLPLYYCLICTKYFLFKDNMRVPSRGVYVWYVYSMIHNACRAMLRI